MNDVFFFFNDTATTEIYTLSLHDALPIYLLKGFGFRWGIGLCLAGLAGVAGRQGHADRAARLFGAAEALHEAIHDPPPPAHRREIEQNVALARAHLGEARWKTGWAEGRTMSLEQAIAYALDPSTVPTQ